VLPRRELKQCRSVAATRAKAAPQCCRNDASCSSVAATGAATALLRSHDTCCNSVATLPRRELQHYNATSLQCCSNASLHHCSSMLPAPSPQSSRASCGVVTSDVALSIFVHWTSVRWTFVHRTFICRTSVRWTSVHRTFIRRTSVPGLQFVGLPSLDFSSSDFRPWTSVRRTSVPGLQFVGLPSVGPTSCCPTVSTSCVLRPAPCRPVVLRPTPCRPAPTSCRLDVLRDFVLQSCILHIVVVHLVVLWSCVL
jgi:hypothetical protein